MLKMIGVVLVVVVVAAIVFIGVLVDVRRRRQSAIEVARQLASAPNAEFATMKRAADAVALLTADRLAAGRLGCFARATLAPPESDRVQSGLEQLLRAVESGMAELERRADTFSAAGSCLAAFAATRGESQGATAALALPAALAELAGLPGADIDPDSLAGVVARLRAAHPPLTHTPSISNTPTPGKATIATRLSPAMRPADPHAEAKAALLADMARLRLDTEWPGLPGWPYYARLASGYDVTLTRNMRDFAEKVRAARERAQACPRCGSWAPVEYHVYVAEGPADAVGGAAGGPVPAASHAGLRQQQPESGSDPEVDRAELIEWVQARKFSTTRLRPGYDIDEVDAFIDAIRDSFRGVLEPSLTSGEIRVKQFSTTRLRRGYDEEEVDAFLDEAESRLAARLGARRETAAAGPEFGAADPAAEPVQIRCLECGAESAEAARVCVRCGAPAVHQLSVAADPGAQVTSSSDATARQQLPSRPAPDWEAGGAMLAGWVEARRFSTSRLRPGYDQEEVDAFLDEIRDSFLGVRQPSLTSGGIRGKCFSTTRLRPGYDEDEVDAFLDEAESRLSVQVLPSGARPGKNNVGSGKSRDDWRVCIGFGDLPRSLDTFRQALILHLESRLGDQVAVGSSATQIFVYAPSAGLADEAAQVARELLAWRDLSAPVRTDFWSLREWKWRDRRDDPSYDPAAHRNTGRQEAERKRSVMTGVPAWQVRVEVPSHRDVVALAGHLAAQGWRVRRRPRSLIVSANCEDDAKSLGRALSGDGRADTDTAFRIGRVSCRCMYVLPPMG